MLPIPNLVPPLFCIQIIIVAIVIVLTSGLITCVIIHYKMGARSWSERRSRPLPQPPSLHPPHGPSPPTASALYTPASIQDRQRLETAAYHDRQVRLQSVQKDFALGLPSTIALPDGEEQPYGSMKAIHLRDPEQESEIYQACIRPPPNRTIFEKDAPPPYRSSSADHLRKPYTPLSIGRTSDGAPLVIHSYGTSSSQSVLPPQAMPHLPLSFGSVPGRLARVATSRFHHFEPPPQYEDIVHCRDSTHVTASQYDSGV